VTNSTVACKLYISVYKAFTGGKKNLYYLICVNVRPNDVNKY